MIDEIRTAIVELFKQMRTPTGVLRDFALVKPGSEAPDIGLQPAITVDWNGKAAMKLVGGRIEYRIGINLVLYSTGPSLLSLEDGSAEHLRLVCRAEGGRLVGMLPAAVHLIGGIELDDGTGFLVEISDEIKSFGAKAPQGGWSFMSEQRLEFQTWLNPGQVIAS